MKNPVVNPSCRESNSSVLPLVLLYFSQPLIEDGHKVRFFDIALERPSSNEVISRTKSEKSKYKM